MPPYNALGLDLVDGTWERLRAAAGATVDATTPAQAVADYPTHHPGSGLNEQRPLDWWDAVVATAQELRSSHPDEYGSVRAIVVSGHSLGALPLDERRRPLQERTPIWSDTRGEPHAAEFFSSFDEDDWYLRTGNGFSRGLYPVFKLMWLRERHPQVLGRMATVVGCKDFVNYLLTGELVTDHSYASGSGAYNLATGDYDPEILAAAGLDRSLLPTPVEAHDIVGEVLPDVADELGLDRGVVVFAGGVDNACMAAGSRLTSSGRAYASLGSSSWLTVASEAPVLDTVSRPFVFRHLIPGLHVSALSTFSTGTSFTWVRELMFCDIGVVSLLDEAMLAPIGAGGVSFLPTLAGGTPLEGGSAVLGGFLGLSLGSTRAHIVRAVMESIAMSIARSLHALERLTTVRRPILLTGGGSSHEGWNAIYAATMDAELYRTSISRDAATLGAAAAAFVGLGAWDSYADADNAHLDSERVGVRDTWVEEYRAVQERFRRDCELNATRSAASHVV